MPQPRLHRDHGARQAAYRRRQAEARADQLRAKGLPALPPIATMPGHTRWMQAIEQTTCLLTEIAAEMQDYFDDRSDTWKEDDRGERHQQRTDALQDIVEALGTVWD